MIIQGAWLTDIDDTVVWSGETPPDSFIEWLSEKIRILRKHNIYWVPMSGVAMEKLGPRILYRLDHDILDNVIYYAGDGSQKYSYDTENNIWKEDLVFKRVFTEEQRAEVFSIIDELKEILARNGYDPDKSETYFRGGSVSWMMLGDISAEPYRESKAIRLREKLIEYAKKRLGEKNNLRNLGTAGVVIPFPGARGIKFVLEGNNKARATRNLIEAYGINNRDILFAGNELFSGGNDNMMREISGITILSLGDKTDPGEWIVDGCIGENNKVSNVEANKLWMDWVCARLELGYGWEGVLHTMRILGSRIFLIREKALEDRKRVKNPGRKDIKAIFFDKGGTLSFREPFEDDGESDIREIMELVGIRADLRSFHKMLKEREKEYKDWSLETEIEADEETIWTKWMLPEYPKERVSSNAIELNLLWSHSKGNRTFRTEAYDIIKELYSRGYKIGIISNTVSRVLVPGEIEEVGLAEFIDTLIMSSLTNLRKPDSRMFLMATETMNVDPSKSAYVGDKPNRDVEGPRRAGYRLTIVLENDKMGLLEELTPIQRPDIIIKSFYELLEIFP